ncbi:hypothetical protein C8J55DRAFT_416851, partial [Lentinula edodes]
EGVEYVIRTDKEVLDQMDDWCTKQHGTSGLTRSCLVSCYTREYVAKAVLAYVKRWVPNSRNAVLAGNSVHADRSFLVKEMPELINWLHYRCVILLAISLSKLMRVHWMTSRIVGGSIYRQKFTQQLTLSSRCIFD